MRGPEFRDFSLEASGACGARALQIIYNYHLGRTSSQERITRELGTTGLGTLEGGTTVLQMTGHLTRNGVSVMEFFGADWDLLTHFVNDPKYAVVVDYWDSDSQDENGGYFGHYDVAQAIVYDTIHFVDGSTMSRQEFEEKWHDFEEDETGHRMRIDRYMLATYLPKRVSIFGG